MDVRLHLFLRHWKRCCPLNVDIAALSATLEPRLNPPFAVEGCEDAMARMRSGTLKLSQ